MTQVITTQDPMTIGIDLGDRYSCFAVIDRHAEVVEEGRLRTTPEAFRQRFAG